MGRKNSRPVSRTEQIFSGIKLACRLETENRQWLKKYPDGDAVGLWVEAASARERYQALMTMEERILAGLEEKEGMNHTAETEKEAFCIYEQTDVGRVLVGGVVKHGNLNWCFKPEALPPVTPLGPDEAGSRSAALLILNAFSLTKKYLPSDLKRGETPSWVAAEIARLSA